MHDMSFCAMSSNVMSRMLCHFIRIAMSCYAFLAFSIAYVFRVGHSLNLYLSSECAINFLSSQYNITVMIEPPTNTNERERKKTTKQNTRTNKSSSNANPAFLPRFQRLGKAGNKILSFGRQYNELSLQSVNYGKFHNKDALIQALPEGSSDILKEKFSNQARLMM